MPDFANLDHLETIAPSQRQRAEALLGGSSPVAGGGDAPAIGDLLGRARAIEDEVRELAGINALIRAIEAGEPAPPYIPASDRLPRLDPEKRVQPIRDFNELLDVALSVVDGHDDPIAVERALDGFSRLAPDPPLDFRLLCAPLLQRATTPPTGTGDRSAVGDELKRLVLRWLKGNAPGSDRRDATPEEFLELRVLEIVRRIRARKPAPLLALPTHGAWVDPVALVDRMKWYQSSGVEMGESDLLQAILRLAPERRDIALAAAAGLRGQEGDAVRYALGGGEAPRAGARSFLSRLFRSSAEPLWPLWAAAARARAPFGCDATLAGTPVEAFPYGARPATYRWTPKSSKPAYASTAEYFIDVSGPRIDHDDRSCYPLALFWVGERRWIVGSAADIRHRHTIWPIDATPSFAIGIHSIVDRIFRPASTFTPTAAYLEPLLDADSRVPELGILSLALALIAQDADARTMATDAAIALFADGRSDGRDLGIIYARLRRTVEGFVKLGRVADALEPLSRISPAHRDAALRCVEEILLAVDPPAPKDLHSLLSLYRELLASARRGADERLNVLLDSIGGSGKAAKLATEIRAIQGGGSSTDATAALLTRRLEIVEDWARRRDGADVTS